MPSLAPLACSATQIQNTGFRASRAARKIEAYNQRLKKKDFTVRWEAGTRRDNANLNPPYLVATWQFRAQKSTPPECRYGTQVACLLSSLPRVTVITAAAAKYCVGGRRAPPSRRQHTAAYIPLFGCLLGRRTAQPQNTDKNMRFSRNSILAFRTAPAVMMVMQLHLVAATSSRFDVVPSIAKLPKGAMLPSYHNISVAPIFDSCAKTGENCKAAGCCADPAMACMSSVADHTRSECMRRATPCVSTPKWRCPSGDQCTSLFKDCRTTLCCQEAPFFRGAPHVPFECVRRPHLYFAQCRPTTEERKRTPGTLYAAAAAAEPSQSRTAAPHATAPHTTTPPHAAPPHATSPQATAPHAAAPHVTAPHAAPSPLSLAAAAHGAAATAGTGGAGGGSSHYQCVDSDDWLCPGWERCAAPYAECTMSRKPPPKRGIYRRHRDRTASGACPAS